MGKLKERGFTLIEVLVYISIFMILFSVIGNSVKNKREKYEFAMEKRNISQFIRKIQQYSQYNKREYILDFRISENRVYFIDNNNGKNEVVDKMEISKNISYMTNNQRKNEDFVRKTTLEGNFEKGFSVYLLDKKGERIHYRISTNTINAAKYPIISIYRAKKPLKLDEDYTNGKLWEEEL